MAQLTLPQFRPGPLSQAAADALNQLARECLRAANVRASYPLVLQDDAGGLRITADFAPPFWAKTAGEASGKYGWVEQKEQTNGGFVDKPQGRTGSTTVRYARELNGRTGIADGTLVQLYRGFLNAGSALEEYLFSLPAGGGGGASGFTRQAFSNVNYTITGSSDVVVAQTGTLTAARTVTLPAASGRAGQVVIFVDESGSLSGTNTITLQRAGTDTVNGGTSVVTAQPRGRIILSSNGSNAWNTITERVAVGSGANHSMGLVPDPGVAAGTTKFLREDMTYAVPATANHNLLSATHPDTNAQAPAKGKVVVASASLWDALTLGTNGQVITADSAQTLGVKWADPQNFDRQTFSNANYTVTGTRDVIVAQTGTLTAARTVSLPAANGRAGQLVIITDESNSATGVKAIRAAPTGGDNLLGDTVAVDVIIGSYGAVILKSDGSANWFTVGGGGPTTNNADITAAGAVHVKCANVRPIAGAMAVAKNGLNIFRCGATSSFAATAETSFFTLLGGSGTAGDRTIAANTTDTYECWRITTDGDYKHTDTNTLRLKIKFGTVAVFDTTAVNFPTASTTTRWWLDLIVVRNYQGGDSISGHGRLWFDAGDGAAPVCYSRRNTGTVDFTANVTVDFTGIWTSSVTAGDAFNMRSFVIENLPSPP